MKRSPTGRYETTIVGGEKVQAFMPASLPRLNGAARLLRDTALFLYSFVRKAAVPSSQIEGTQSSLCDLLLFELDAAPGVPLDDVVEVSNYVAALDTGVGRRGAALGGK